MSTLLIYGLCLVGALGLYLLMRPGDEGRRTQGLRTLGAVLGLGVVGYFVIAITDATVGPQRSPQLFFSLFALVSVVSATQMITTSRPVYAALHFVLVVLASAGLFLLLEAEFMAFALIIVYAGAILITYMFVLMLAQQAPSDGEAGTPSQPEYDRFSREPAAGAIVAFVLLAVLTQTIFDTDGGAITRRPAVDPPTALVASWNRLTEMPRRLDEVVADIRPGAVPVDPAAGEPALNLLLGVRAVLDGDVRYDQLAGRLGPGVQVDEVLLPETVGADTTTVVMFSIDGRTSEFDTAAVLADPTIVEDEARRVLAASNLRLAEGGELTFVVSVDAEVRATVPADADGGTAASESAAAADAGDAADTADDPGQPATAMVRLPGSARPDNIQDVGFALITRFPASLEIAGVILLMAMFGAVLLARRQIEIGEDEKRAAVGLRPLGHYDEGDDGTDDAAATAGGSA